MPRWLWFVPFGALVAVFALVAFRLGWIASTITETDVIETYTARYVAAHGPDARVTDCSAQPSTRAEVWIIVTCISAQGVRVDYPVDRLGRLLEIEPALRRVDEPKT